MTVSEPARSALGILPVCVAWFIYCSVLGTGLVPDLLFWGYLWYSRGRNDPSFVGDGAIFTSWLLIRFRHLVVDNLQRTGYFQSGLHLCYASAIILGVIFLARSYLKPSSPPSEAKDTERAHRFDAPLIYRSKTTHTRLFPKKHSFSYSYLLVAIPVGYRGRCGSLISVDTQESRSWFHVQGADYLERTCEGEGLEAKLVSYLQGQNVQNDEWAYAYLVTAPRFLNYSFNPASFWYIYDKKHQLIKMVVEVNNTFNERRLYLLDAQSIDADHDPNEPSSRDTKISQATSFTNTWAKDFHVSPFSSRKGSYFISAEDPFGGDRTVAGTVNTRIVLRSSKAHGKLVARLFSEGEAIDPRQLSRTEQLRLIAGWCWVGFMTFPRIHKEAGRLFFSRKLSIWLRPEITPASIGRQSTAFEKVLETFFVRFVEHVVSEHDQRIRLTYSTSGDGKRVFLSEATNLSTATVEVELKVLTPAFFARFIHYCHTADALDRECFLANELDRTIWTSSLEALSRLLAGTTPISTDTSTTRLPSRVEDLRWTVHRWLRCPPAKPTHGATLPTDGPKSREAGPQPLSQLDRFVRDHCPEDSFAYRRACATQFLATRLAFDMTGVIQAADLALRALLMAYVTLPVMTNGPGDATWQNDGILARTASLTALHILSWIKGL